jgi:hypothetical protein
MNLGTIVFFLFCLFWIIPKILRLFEQIYPARLRTQGPGLCATFPASGPSTPRNVKLRNRILGLTSKPPSPELSAMAEEQVRAEAECLAGT